MDRGRAQAGIEGRFWAANLRSPTTHTGCRIGDTRRHTAHRHSQQDPLQLRNDPLYVGDLGRRPVLRARAHAGARADPVDDLEAQIAHDQAALAVLQDQTLAVDAQIADVQGG